MSIERIKLADDVVIYKGNSAIIFELTGNSELFESFLEAEKNMSVDYSRCLTQARKAMEDFGVYYGACVKQQEQDLSFEDAKNLVIKEAISAGKNRAKVNNGNRVDQEKSEKTRKDLFVDACRKIDVNKQKILVNWYISKFGENSKSRKPSVANTVNLAYELYSKFSGVTHGEQKGTCEEAKNLLITLFNIVFAYFDSDYSFRLDKVPFGEYFPIPNEDFGKMCLYEQDQRKIFVREERTGISYYYIKNVVRDNNKVSDSAVRDEEIFDLLWEKSLDNPQNIVMARGEIGEKDYLSKVYKFKGRPYGLTDKYINSLSYESRYQLITKVIVAVESLHKADYPVYLRGLSRNAIYVCENGDNVIPFIVNFGYAKSYGIVSENTVLGKIKDLKKITEERSFIAPELFDGELVDERYWGKADVYSIGKLIQIILNDEEIKKDSQISQVLPKMIMKDYKSRISIFEVSDTIFERVKPKLGCGVASCMGIGKSMEDSFVIKGRELGESDSVCEEFDVEFPIYASVIDGMGGGVFGKEVAKKVAEETRVYFDNRFDINSVEESFIKMMHYLQEKVLHVSKSLGSTYSGCTAVFAYIYENRFYYANVGDCRIYYIDSCGISQLSQDHRFSSGVVKKGELYQFFGMDEDEGAMEPYVHVQNISEVGYILLCSDGLSDYITNEEILSIINDSGSLSDKVQKLVSNAKENGSKDDITVIVLGRK